MDHRSYRGLATFRDLCLVVTVGTFLGCSSSARTDASTDSRGDSPTADAVTDGARARCATDLDCSDNLFCTGIERCAPTVLGADARGCVAANPAGPCRTDQLCDEAGARCTTNCASPDVDGDGHRSIPCGGDDCDDRDPRRYPGHVEICDYVGVDEDCDPRTLGPDADNDGLPSQLCCNAQATGIPLCGTDCDDTRATVNPTAVETCNNLDDDCDGMVDESIVSTYYPDCDGDSFGAMSTTAVTMPGCVAPTTGPTGCPTRSWSTSNTDCNDTLPTSHPGLVEVCDGVDNDCDGITDNNAGVLYYADCDQDAFGNASSTAGPTCTPPTTPPSCPLGLTGVWQTRPFDCDDTRPGVQPGTVELCNGLDDECDGMTDNEPAAGADCAARVQYGSSVCSAGACTPTCAGGYHPTGPTCTPTMRPLAPWSTGNATSMRPTFRWGAMSPGGASGKIEVCADRACSTVITSGDGADPASSGRSNWAPAADLPPGVVFWRVFGRSGTDVATTPSVTWQVTIGHRTTPLNASWGAHLDVNGDGYDDVMISNGVNTTDVHFGGPTTPSTTPTAVVAAYGSIAAAGDVNGDGYGDALIGNLLFLGGASGLASTPNATFDTAYSPSYAPAGDVNADGYSDVVVGNGYNSNARVYLGGSAGLAASAGTTLAPVLGWFGSWVSDAGDINGDGFGDIVVGENPTTTNTGFYVFHGTSTGIDPTLGQRFPGAAPVCAGDVNGDGYADILSRTVTNPATDARGELFYGSAMGFSVAPLLFGTIVNAVVAVGDVNGDGFSDVQEGSSLYFGGTTVWSSGAPFSCGYQCRAAGDVNRDGFADLLGQGSFVIDLWFGRAAFSSRLQDVRFTGPSGTSAYGTWYANGRRLQRLRPRCVPH